MSEPFNGDLVPVPPEQPKLPPDQQALADLFGGRGVVVWHSFKADTPEGRVLLDKCEEMPDFKLSEQANRVIMLRDVYAHEVTLVKEETGEATEAVRCCLIDTEGKVYACVSEGVRKSLSRLFRGHGLPPYKSGIPIVVSLKRLAGGRNWLTITNQIPADNGKKGSK